MLRGLTVQFIGYSGDTEWTDALLEIADQADLFICEAYTLDTRSSTT